MQMLYSTLQVIYMPWSLDSRRGTSIALLVHCPFLRYANLLISCKISTWLPLLRELSLSSMALAHTSPEPVPALMPKPRMSLCMRSTNEQDWNLECSERKHERAESTPAIIQVDRGAYIRADDLSNENLVSYHQPEQQPKAKNRVNTPR